VVRCNSVCRHRQRLLQGPLVGRPGPLHNGVHLARGDDPRQVVEEDVLVGSLHHYPSSVVALLVVVAAAVCGHTELPVGHIRPEEHDQHRVVLCLVARTFDRRSAKFVAVVLSLSIHRWDPRQQCRRLVLEVVLASDLAHYAGQVRVNLQSVGYLLRAWASGSLGSRDGLLHRWR
jgi:hypothetical protein